ncbi:MAG TPA: hypothetical protein VKZ60_03910 [Chloroflexota bacterium]|nr:hypothetical protein [Chloroflexota bacterium]
MAGGEWLLAAAPLVWLLAVIVQESRRWRPLRRPPDWQAAEARAEALLREVLGPAGYAAWHRDGYLCVPSGLYPGRHYRVYRPPRLVEVYEQGQRVAALCLQPTGYLPPSDRVLLHKLLLEGDEAQYLRVARASRPGRLEFPPRPRGPGRAQRVIDLRRAAPEAACATAPERLY